MDAGNLAALLGALRSGDNAARTAAEKTYNEATASAPGRVLTTLASLLSVASCPEEVVRLQAATLLRRAVVQAGPGETAWSRAGAAEQAQVRSALFQAVEAEPSASVRKLVLAGISAVAANEEEPWTDLIPNAFTLASSAEATHREAAFRLLAELMTTQYKEGILRRRQELGGLVAAGLAQQPLQAVALALVMEMAPVVESKELEALQPVLPMIEQALKGLGASDSSAFDEALQSVVACAAERALFFKPRYREWVEMMLTFAGARGAIEDGSRGLAFEWVSTIAESKCKALSKAVPELPTAVLSVAFAFMAEAEEDERWVDIDEEAEKDEDGGLCEAGEAKVDFFVKQLGFAKTSAALMSLLRQYAASQKWEGRLAAAMAIRAAVEYVDNAAALDDMTKLLLHMVQDQHMRVRYAALLALGQACHDQEDGYQARWQKQLLPRLAQAVADPVNRCAAMAAGGIEALIAELSEEDLEPHAPLLLETLVGKLTACSHKGVLVAVMEAIGALAAGLEGSFEQYYDQLMAMLLAFVSRPEAQGDAALLRGKAFECISLLGFSVGKERFRASAQQTMQAMLAMPKAADSVQTDCVRQAMERMCTVMGSDFAPFLPALLPGVLSCISLESAVSCTDLDEEDADDEITLPTENGLMKVKTGQIQEILALVNLLTVFVKETDQSFYEYIKPTAEALNKVLGCADPVLNFASEVRDAVYPCWAELVGVARRAGPARGQEALALLHELVQRFVEKVAGDLVKAEDPDDIAPMANGIGLVIRNAGEGCLQPAQVQGMCDLAVSEILKSFQREMALKDAGSLEQQMPAAALAEDDEEDDEVVGDAMGMGEEEEEQECRKSLCAIFGSCMRAAPEIFVTHSWPTLQKLMHEWLSPQGGALGTAGRPLALSLACDFCEHLGERAVAVWPNYMDAVLEATCSEDADLRNTSAYAVLMASQVPAFGPQYGARAYVALGMSLQKFKVKKSEEDAQRASENVTAALVQLCLSHPGQCPDLDACWQAAFTRLPFKVDLEEGRKLHRKLFLETQKPGGGNLGGARVAHVLGYLCENYGRSEQFDEDLQKEMAAAFGKLSPQNAQELLAALPAKQRQKAERVFKDSQK